MIEVNLLRLDKLLANKGFGSRKDVKIFLKKNDVYVNNKRIKEAKHKLNLAVDDIEVNGQLLQYEEYIYLMMYKPAGYISATVDLKEKTVIDLLNEKEKLFEPFPVGRLDKDTEGLLLITNDGKLAHVLTSPKHEVKKKYYAHIQGVVTQDDIDSFNKGVMLEDDYVAKPAELQILTRNSKMNQSEIEVTITEGKYHQVKRMFEAVNKKVIYLKRISMGEILLDSDLSIGKVRPLTKYELTYCMSVK